MTNSTSSYCHDQESSSPEFGSLGSFSDANTILPGKMGASRRMSLSKVPFLDFNFYPVRHDAVDDILAPIPVVTPEMSIISLSIAAGTTKTVVSHYDCPSPPSAESMFVLSFLVEDSDSDRCEVVSKDEEAATMASFFGSSSAASSSPAATTTEEDQRFKPFHDEKWKLRFQELLAFHRLHGHDAVPHTYLSNPQLARWVKRQRRQYKLLQENRVSTMTVERAQLLEDLGFVWDSHGVNWRQKFASLVTYKRVKGHCDVLSNNSDRKLATWVKCQRRQYKLYKDDKASSITHERISELEAIGFRWGVRVLYTSKTYKMNKALNAAATAA